MVEHICRALEWSLFNVIQGTLQLRAHSGFRCFRWLEVRGILWSAVVSTVLARLLICGRKDHGKGAHPHCDCSGD